MKKRISEKSARTRKIVSLVILSCGIVLALLLVVGATVTPQKPIVSLVDATNQGQSSQTNGSEGFFNLDPLGTSTSATLNENLTSELAQNYVKSISDLNAHSPSSATGTFNMPAPGTINNALTQALSSGLQIPEFTEADIKIGSDNSTSSRIAYIQTLATISQKNFSGFSTPISFILEDFANNNDTTDLIKYVAIIKNQIHDLLAIQTPPQLESWHIQNLNLWEKKLIVFSALLNSNSDPLKAALAIREVSSVIQQTHDTDKVINDYASKLQG